MILLISLRKNIISCLKLLAQRQSLLRQRVTLLTIQDTSSILSGSILQEQPKLEKEFQRVIKTCLFDMGNVLVNFSHEKMCSQIGVLCAKTGSEIHELLFGSGLQRRFECGELGKEEFASELEGIVNTQFDLDELILAGSDIFDPNQKMFALLEELSQKNIRLVLLSNTSIGHYEFVERTYDLLRYFHAEVLSFQVGAVKPDDEIYLAALDKIDCTPEECFFTDDIPEYVTAAKLHGIRAELFQNAEACRQSLVEYGVLDY